MSVKKKKNNQSAIKKNVQNKSSIVKKRTIRKHRVSREQQEIRQVVKDIPALILKEKPVENTTKDIVSDYHDMVNISTNSNHMPTQQTVVSTYIGPHHGKTYLWIGVSILILIVLVMWGLNVSTMFYEEKQNQDIAEQIYTTSKEDMTNIIATFSDSENQVEQTPGPDNNETTDDHIKQAISNVLVPLITTTNTPPNTTTTTSTIL